MLFRDIELQPELGFEISSKALIEQCPARYLAVQWSMIGV